MATPSRIEGDYVYAGKVIFAGEVVFPDAVIGDEQIKADAQIAASKQIRHQSIDSVLAEVGVDIAALSRLVHLCRRAGEVLDLQVICTAAPTGDRTVSIDLHKSTGGGAFATILTAPIELDSSTTVRTAVAGVLAGSGAPALLAGDILLLVVTLGGSSGDYAEGVVASLHVTEKYS